MKVYSVNVTSEIPKIFSTAIKAIVYTQQEFPDFLITQGQFSSTALNDIKPLDLKALLLKDKAVLIDDSEGCFNVEVFVVEVE